MNENRMMQQVMAIFSVFMVVFYLGVGSYLIFFSDFSYLNKAVRMIMGYTFILYGVFRAYRTYVKIVELFFNNDSNES